MTMQEPIKLADLDDVALTASQGFRAMATFLSAYMKRTRGQGPIRTLVGDIEIESDESSTDPAALSDWKECVKAVLAEGRGYLQLSDLDKQLLTRLLSADFPGRDALRKQARVASVRETKPES